MEPAHVVARIKEEGDIWGLDLNSTYDEYTNQEAEKAGGVPMNPVDRVLYQELTHLIDRLSTTVPNGSLTQAVTANPYLRARLDEADTQLAVARATLLEGYGRWQRALEDMENLWALAAWRRSAAPEEPTEQAAALAA
jgi:hypothetical protein